MNTHCVITTINQPSAAVRAWEKLFGEKFIVIGDEKTPPEWSCGRSDFYSTKRQLEILFCKSARLIPFNHYARKNIGYLLAMSRAESIFETDDDNAPNDENFLMREEAVSPFLIKQKGWVNIYRTMNPRVSIWPRGFPLTQCTNSPPIEVLFSDEGEVGESKISSPIQQGLANVNPDVDAVWRLTHKPYERFYFSKTKSVALSEGVWCPFNSQSTWWFPDAFPLMYLPITATFRMTDIWRSFVAQRCLWAMGKMVTFHSPAEVFQNRNDHNLLKDFESELLGYLHNEKIATALDALNLGADVFNNMRTCYAEIIKLGLLRDPEIMALDAWIEDVKRITNGNAG